MTDLKTRVRMAWAVLRGRSVMYRWHATSGGMIPKTLGAISVENTGTTEITVDLTDKACGHHDSEASTAPADRSASEFLESDGQPSMK